MHTIITQHTPAKKGEGGLATQIHIWLGGLWTCQLGNLYHIIDDLLEGE